MRHFLCIMLCLLLPGLIGCSKKVIVVKTDPAETHKSVDSHASNDNIIASNNHLAQAKKFYVEEKYKQTLKHCEKAIQFNRRNWEAHYYLGLAMQKRKEYARSIEVLGTGLEYCPDNKFVKSEIHYAIGYNWENLGHFSNADKEYTMALEFNPKNSSARDAQNRIKMEKTIKNWGKKKKIEYDG